MRPACNVKQCNMFRLHSLGPSTRRTRSQWNLNLPLRHEEANANTAEPTSFQFLTFTHLLGRENLIAFNIITEKVFFFNLNVAYHEDISKEKV